MEYCLSSFQNIPEEVYNWVKNPTKSLILYGESGTGKTELAKALMSNMNLNYLFVRDLNGLKSLDNEYHKGIIFDDLDTKDISREQMIHLIDRENPSDIRVLYGIVVITKEVIKIFTTNDLNSLLYFRDKSLTRRTKTVEIKNCLYPDSSTTSSLDDNTSSLDDNDS